MHKKIVAYTVGFIALAMALFHLYSAGIGLLAALQQRSLHWGLGLALVFLLYPIFKGNGNDEGEKSASQHWVFMVFNALLAMVSIAIAVYVYFNYVEIFTRSLVSPTPIILITGIAVIVLSLEATRRVLGWPLTIIGAIFLVYAFIGQHLPPALQHSGMSIERIITQIGLSTGGIFGAPMGVSATYVILFIIFGSFLNRSGAGDAFMDFAMGLVGNFRGGAAKVAVVASSLFGAITGNAVSNVATSGVITIPLMKRSGYKKEFAAAVEAIASTGGLFVPPVMGAVAFLIADFLQIPFAQVVLAAIIPAVLYYFAVYLTVDIRAAKENIVSKVNEDVDLRRLLIEKGHLFIPLLILIYLLIIAQKPALYSAFCAIISVPVISFLRKETRMSINQMIVALQEGVKMSLVVLCACATAGIVIGVISMTGMGLRFSGLLLDLAGGNVFLLSILLAISSIILGMGLPPVASYLILAVLGAPALIQLGVDPLAAHLFIFYFGALSAITPPVALAAFTAAGIAGSDPFKTSFVACKIGLIAFIFPFMIVFSPALILEGSVIEIIIATLTALLGVFALVVSLEGYLKDKLHIIPRLVLSIGAILLFHPDVIAKSIGFILVAVVLILQFLKGKSISKKGYSRKSISLS